MAHQIEQMAYVGDTPWHGLGNCLSPSQPLEVWQREAGMDWAIQETPVRFTTPEMLSEFPEQKVLYRSDSGTALSVVSKRYQVVQPREVLEFYRDLTTVSGYELETAGVLKGGRKFWALARSGQSTSLKGGDEVSGYLLLATSCDGSLATTATPTTVRVVCNNTLAIAVNGASEAIKVPHNTRFDPECIKRRLGIAVSKWDEFMYRMRVLADRKVDSSETNSFIRHVLYGAEPQIETLGKAKNERAITVVHQLYEGAGRGAELASAKGTAWGLLNAVTEYVDHKRRARSTDYRLDSAWFGQGALIKQRALDAALDLVA